MIEKLLRPRSQVTIIATLIVTVLGYHFLLVWPASIQLPNKQKAFLIAIEEGDNAAWDDLISETYLDQWEFSKNNVLVTLQDVRSQLLGVSIDWKEHSKNIETSEATLEGGMHFEASGLFSTDFITSRINGLDAPWMFQWSKESWLPWSWKLTRIENPDLQLHGYSPGDIGRRTGR